MLTKNKRRKKRGRPPLPAEARGVKVSFYIYKPLWDRFKAHCIAKNKKISHEICNAIQIYLNMRDLHVHMAKTRFKEMASGFHHDGA